MRDEELQRSRALGGGSFGYAGTMAGDDWGKVKRKRLCLEACAVGKQAQFVITRWEHFEKTA